MKIEDVTGNEIVKANIQFKVGGITFDKGKPFLFGFIGFNKVEVPVEACEVVGDVSKG